MINTLQISVLLSFHFVGEKDNFLKALISYRHFSEKVYNRNLKRIQELTRMQLIFLVDRDFFFMYLYMRPH